MTLVDTVVRRERDVLAATLILIPLLCWAWIVPMAHDMYGAMTGPSAWMMTTVWDARHIALLFAMWTVMMIGMMLPSAAPALLMFAAVMRRSDAGRRAPLRVYPLAAGYLTVWIGFSAAATMLQRILSHALALSPNVSFITEHLQPGASGAFRLGLHHGWHCLGCCWALLLPLFAGGVMNLTVIAALTVFVILEKVAPLGWVGSWLSAGFLMAIVVWIITASA